MAIRYGAGGKPMIIQEIVSEETIEEVKPPKKKKVEILEERIKDSLPSDADPIMFPTEDSGEDK
jgi:hypothetical protein